MKKVVNKFIFADQLEKPKDTIKYRPRNQGGLQLHNIDCKATGMLIKTFLELAINPDYNNSLYFKAVYDHHVLNNTNTNDPGCPPTYNQQFFQTIRSAMGDNRVEVWSSKQWYSYLLDKTLLCEEIGDNGQTSWEPIKCKAETTFTEYDWSTIWDKVCF